MTTVIYILSVYEEHGAEELRAFSSFDAAMLAIPSYGYGPDHNSWSHIKDQLDFIAGTWAPAGVEVRDRRWEPSEDSYNLCSGWGGIQMHIVELEAE